MRNIRLLVLRLMLGAYCMFLTVPINASEIFSYVGNDFLYKGGIGTTKVTGSFTVSSVLAPNTTYELWKSPLLLSYQFSDGRLTWTQANYSGPISSWPGLPVTDDEIAIKTDAIGNIKSWQINLVNNNPLSIITTQSIDYAAAGGPQGQCLDATDWYRVYDSYTHPAIYSGGNGENGVSGAWSKSTVSCSPAVPEPSTVVLLLFGLTVIAILTQYKKPGHSATVSA
jgi:PEP-CTERM motif